MPRNQSGKAAMRPSPPQAASNGGGRRKSRPAAAAAASEADGLLKMSPFLSESAVPKSSFADLLSLADNDDVRFTYASGLIFAFLNGLTTPALAYVISNGLSDLAGAHSDEIVAGEDGGGGGSSMAGVRRTALYFAGVGAFAFLTSFMQNMCMEVGAARTQRMLLTKWFGALLKQDAAFYDVYDPTVLAPTVEPNSQKVRRGLGRKLGEGVQFLTAFVGGVVYALLSSWRVALVLLGTVPLVAVSVYGAYRSDRDRPRRAGEAYSGSRAAGAARNAIYAMRTVTCRNAGAEMVRRYGEGTDDTYRRSVASLWRDGLVVGTALSSFFVLFCVFTLYGSYLLYGDVRATGCDPSGSVDDGDGARGTSTCVSSGAAILGALLGIAFAAQGVSQLPPVFDAVQGAREGCYPAMIALKRCEGADAEEVVVALPKTKKTSSRSIVGGIGNGSSDVEAGESTQRVRAMLPRYVIDSSSSGGLRPKGMAGALSFRSVSFAFPTKPSEHVLDDLNLSVKAGMTIALVGNRHSGKSAISQLLQRFYDPTFGVITVDGVDIRDINIHYLRSKVRYVGADPVVFETSVATNIQIGKPGGGASRQDVKRAAEMAGIHDFIMTLPDAYNSVIGDWGVQLTGVQMQRIALARALISDPKVLIFDEATKALDRESADAIQEIIDDLSYQRTRTTIILPTRLSTILNADSIVVLDQGNVVEMGHHDSLMASRTGYYRSLVEKENSTPTADESFVQRRADAAEADAEDGGGNGPLVRDDRLLRFFNVSFSYPSRPNKMILKGFNLSVRQGELLALVGPHRSGKLTALALADRLYDPTVGRVEYNGEDVRGLDVNWLRDQICFLQLDAPLLDTTIARNIDPNEEYSQEQIARACGMANVHKEIASLSGGYDAEVRRGGSQLSVCFRQRIAIANAFLKRPNVILLDEASSSAVDGELDDTVQDALERLLTTEGRTTIVVAHRNATVRAADRIAYVVDGRVRELASHDDLMDRRGGRYRALVESQRTRDFLDVESLRRGEVTMRIEDEDEEEEDAMEVEEQVEEGEFKAYDYQRARRIALPDWPFLVLGALGSVVVGGIFPGCGYLFGRVVADIYQRVPSCDSSSGESSCGASYYESVADESWDSSVRYGIYWIVVAVACLIGSAATFWAFGTARERLNRRVRELSFAALMRQEMAYFDRRNAKNILHMLENDAAQIHVFSSEQIRIITTNLTSLTAGLTIACLTMWPLALCSLAVFPLVRFATNLEVSTFLDEESDDREKNQGFDSPGGIVLETLLNIRTVTSLGIERQRYRDYQRALRRENPNFVHMGLMAGLISALPPLIQQLTNALKYWWGGWLLYYYGHLYTFEQLVVSLFSLFFAMLSLGESVRGAQDNEMCQRSAGRVFYLLNRKSSIDPQSEEEEEEELLPPEQEIS